ncbi:hypothetical protein NF212_21705 [Parasalinivibrio latis]|uniref:hypothetical protein n=1 Tax=Parasalinivibrio latis TaxID=2952610 RepID=UPI0030E5680B
MSEQIENEEQVAVNSEEGTDQFIKIPARAPRSGWWEFFLHFGTFGIYTACFFVGRIREIKRISSLEFRPGLWFLVPFVLIAQPFAFGKLGRALNDLEEKSGLQSKKSHYALYCVGYFLISIYFLINDKLPLWLFSVSLFVAPLCITLVFNRVNNLKRARSDLVFFGKSSGYKFYEWVIVVVTVPVMFALSFFALYESFADSAGNRIEARSIYRSDDSDIKLEFYGEGWVQVNTDENSDKPLVAEFSPPVIGGYVMLYRYAPDLTLQELVDGRKELLYEASENFHCQETRKLKPTSVKVRVEITCRGNFLLDQEFAQSVFIEEEDYIYEFVSSLAANGEQYTEWESNYKLMAQGFNTL